MAIFRPTREKVSVQKALLWPFYWKLRLSGVSLESPGLENIPQVLAIFSSPGDSTVTPDGLGLMWNGRRKTFWTLSFELLDRNRSPLHLKTERVAETAWRVSWFWPTSGRYSGTWGIFSSLRDCNIFPKLRKMEKTLVKITMRARRSLPLFQA